MAPGEGIVLLIHTPCNELKVKVVFEFSPSLVGVSRYPPGFGLLSEGTYLSFKDFEKSFLFFEKSRFENLSIYIDPQSVPPEMRSWALVWNDGAHPSEIGEIHVNSLSFRESDAAAIFSEHQ